ncbi:hypothetical protein [Cysteiniphilum sp. 6C5]|uniref:hypothetical protein n=1 Tax=unclassified Cysteiniphilum TaxID=2610889 RepID=UPI003F865C00
MTFKLTKIVSFLSVLLLSEAGFSEDIKIVFPKALENTNLTAVLQNNNTQEKQKLTVTKCIENTCEINVINVQSIKDNHILLKKDNKVVAVIPYGKAFYGQRFFFSSSYEIGRFLLDRVNRHGYTLNTVERLLGVSSSSEVYEALAVVYQSSGYEINTFLSNLSNQALVERLKNSYGKHLLSSPYYDYTYPISRQKHRAMAPLRSSADTASIIEQSLDIASNIPFVNKVAGPALMIFSFLDSIFGFTNSYTLEDVMQKLDEIQVDIRNLGEKLTELRTILNDNAIRESIQRVESSTNEINTSYNQVINILGEHGSDVDAYLAKGSVWGGGNSKNRG